MSMTEDRAREILGEGIGEDDKLRSIDEGYIDVDWPGEIVIDGRFTFDEIEAIAWWVRNK